MINVGIRKTSCHLHKNMEFYVICPKCGQEVIFYGYSVKFCVGSEGCGAEFEVDPRQIMLSIPRRFEYHFGRPNI